MEMECVFSIADLYAINDFAMEFIRVGGWLAWFSCCLSIYGCGPLQLFTDGCGLARVVDVLVNHVEGLVCSRIDMYL
jgi:hypothetical protein